MSTYLVEKTVKHVAFNFGKWESLEYQAKEWHVHINPEVVIALETAEIDSGYGKIGQLKAVWHTKLYIIRDT